MKFFLKAKWQWKIFLYQIIFLIVSLCIICCLFGGGNSCNLKYKNSHLCLQKLNNLSKNSRILKIFNNIISKNNINFSNNLILKLIILQFNLFLIVNTIILSSYRAFTSIVNNIFSYIFRINNNLLKTLKIFFNKFLYRNNNNLFSNKQISKLMSFYSTYKTIGLYEIYNAYLVIQMKSGALRILKVLWYKRTGRDFKRLKTLSSF